MRVIVIARGAGACPAQAGFLPLAGLCSGGVPVEYAGVQAVIRFDLAD
jgi:hypothetical protein